MVAPSASTSQEVKLEVYSNMPRAFQWVIMAATSSPSSLTVGEYNKSIDMCRAVAWVSSVCVPPMYIAVSASSAYIMYGNKSTWGAAGFLPWCQLPVVMLPGVYMSVVWLAMWHLTLFLPQAPYAAREALRHLGLEKVGIAVGLTSCLVLFCDSDQACILWSCLVCVLIAAVIAFWFGLVRMYGDDSGSAKAGLARGLAVCSLLTAVMVPLFFYLTCWYPQMVAARTTRS